MANITFAGLACVILLALTVVQTTATSCSMSQGVCNSGREVLISSTSMSAVDGCCTMCTKNIKCQAWTFWNSTCNTFSAKVNSSHSGNCTSGLTGEKPKRPNFIFVFPDTLRAESFDTYGSLPKGLDVTPNLNKFASTGVRFNQAHVMHTQCAPSRCTMKTGRYMHVLGHRTQTHLIQDYEQNYFRILKDAGYHVQYYGKNDAFSAIAMNLSVTEWHEKIGYGSGDNAFSYGESGYFSFLSTGTNVSGTVRSKSADLDGALSAVEWMQNSPPEPFMLFLPSRGAHPPYGAPAEWHNKFPVDMLKKSGLTLRERNIPGMPNYMSDTTGIPHYRNLTGLDEDTLFKIQSVYLGMVSYTDWIFGQLLDGLEAIPGGLSARTAVFFSSDHGDFGGDYGLVEKWPGSMADVLTRVPLYARIPGGVQGHVANAPVQTADILETMLDLASINISQSEWVRFGQSMRTQLTGGEGDMSRFVYSEGGFHFPNEQMNEANECLNSCPRGLYCPRGQEEVMPNGSPRAVMVRNLTAKLVYRPTGISELYDLEVDPRETKNLFTSPGAIELKSELVNHLVDWMILTSDVTPTKIDSRGPPRFPFAIPSDPWAPELFPQGGDEL